MSSKGCFESITTLLDYYPDSLSLRTKQGKLPLHVAIEFKTSSKIIGTGGRGRDGGFFLPNDETICAGNSLIV